jgi:hypothetical protein
MKQAIREILKQRFGKKPAPQPGWIGNSLKTLNNQPTRKQKPATRKRAK